MTSLRALAGLVAWLAAGTVAAAVVGLLDALALQLVYGVTAAALAVLLHEAPGRGATLLARLCGPMPALQLGAVALGASAALVFPALGAFALTSSAVNERWVDEVWGLWFPTLPLLAALLGIARSARRLLTIWLEAEDD